METTTQFKVDEVVKYVNEDDPSNGVHVLITAVNPLAPLLKEEHYRIFVPGSEVESYAYSRELQSKEIK